MHTFYRLRLLYETVLLACDLLPIMPFQVERKSFITWLTFFDGQTFATKQDLLDFVTQQILSDSKGDGRIESYAKAHDNHWELKCAKCHCMTLLHRNNFMIHLGGSPRCSNTDCYDTLPQYRNQKFPSWLIYSPLTSLQISFRTMTMERTDGCCPLGQVATIKTVA